MELLLQVDIKSKSEMKKIGKSLSKFLKIEDVVCFNGILGAGKTFLCKAIINNITKIKEVTSPTFNIVQTYPLYIENDNEIWHCDFYRLDSYEEVQEIGVFEDLKKKLFC